MINEIQKKALYEKYLAIHKAYHADPEFFTLIQSNTELTTVMGGKFWSWHVVGITKLALLKYMELGFRHKARSGITRAHLIPRIETSTKLLSNRIEFAMEDFFDIWLKSDKTVICASGENKKNFIPEYIPIENHEYLLFRSNTVGWKFSVLREAKFLESLYKKHFE